VLSGIRYTTFALIYRLKESMLFAEMFNNIDLTALTLLYEN